VQETVNCKVLLKAVLPKSLLDDIAEKGNSLIATLKHVLPQAFRLSLKELVEELVFVLANVQQKGATRANQPAMIPPTNMS